MVVKGFASINAGEADKVYFADEHYGFSWGSAKVERIASFPQSGRVVIGVQTPKHNLQVIVTKTGKVRIYENGQEWGPIKACTEDK